MTQVVQHRLGGHGSQVELQAARQHRDRHFLRVRGGQHKFQIFGRLFEGLQHRVERGVGEHVHLVNHEDLEAALHGLVHGLLKQTLHFVHATVGGSVQLGVVHKAARIDVGTGLADTTRISGDAASTVHALAIERFGEHARHRGFAHATCTREQIRVVQTLGGQRIGQGLHDVLLPHHLGEGFGAIFAGKHEVRHKLSILCDLQ